MLAELSWRLTVKQSLLMMREGQGRKKLAFCKSSSKFKRKRPDLLRSRQSKKRSSPTSPAERKSDKSVSCAKLKSALNGSDSNVRPWSENELKFPASKKRLNSVSKTKRTSL